MYLQLNDHSRPWPTMLARTTTTSSNYYTGNSHEIEAPRPILSKRGTPVDVSHVNVFLVKTKLTCVLS